MCILLLLVWELLQATRFQAANMTPPRGLIGFCDRVRSVAPRAADASPVETDAAVDRDPVAATPAAHTHVNTRRESTGSPLQGQDLAGPSNLPVPPSGPTDSEAPALTAVATDPSNQADTVACPEITNQAPTIRAKRGRAGAHTPMQDITNQPAAAAVAEAPVNQRPKRQRRPTARKGC